MNTRLGEIIQTLSAHEKELQQKYHIARIGIFDSYVRNEADADSDLDVLIEFEPESDLGLPGFVAVENHLSDLLGVKVDLVEQSALKPVIGGYVQKEAMFLYDSGYCRLRS